MKERKKRDVLLATMIPPLLRDDAAVGRDRTNGGRTESAMVSYLSLPAAYQGAPVLSTGVPEE